MVYTENHVEEGFRLRLFCVNPAENLGEYLKKGRSAIFFSATMFPMLYYRELLTTDRDAYGIYVQSPFPKENRRILIGSDVSSRYTRRNRAEYRKIAGYIARCVWQRPGNYMVFFPSYRLMEDVLQVYEEEFFRRLGALRVSDTGYDRKGTGRIFGGISGTGRYPGRVLCPWRDFFRGC